VEALAVAVVDTIVINPVTQKTVKSGYCRTFFVIQIDVLERLPEDWQMVRSLLLGVFNL
jgi:hypothetical protein